MSLYYVPGIPDEALVNEMTVFLDPLKTDPRYQPGVDGVSASLFSLNWASRQESFCSILGDMAMCMNIPCRDLPKKIEHFDSEVVRSLIGELEEAVHAYDEGAVYGLLRKMLRAAGLLERKNRPTQST